MSDMTTSKEFLVGPTHLYIQVFRESVCVFMCASVLKKLVEAQSAMTMKIKDGSLYE